MSMSPCLESVTSPVAGITCKIHQAFWLSFCIRQAIKNRSRGRPGDEAKRTYSRACRKQKAAQILLYGYCVATPIGYFYKMAQVKIMHDKPACVQS